MTARSKRASRHYRATELTAGRCRSRPSMAPPGAGPTARPRAVGRLDRAALVALVAVALSPETREPVSPRPRCRPQRASVPAEARGEYYAAALSAFIVFSALGLFAGLAGLFLVVALHDPSHALAGATLFAVFSAGVVAQLATMRWSLRSVCSRPAWR
jgi:hypothetical protein